MGQSNCPLFATVFVCCALCVNVGGAQDRSAQRYLPLENEGDPERVLEELKRRIGRIEALRELSRQIADADKINLQQLQEKLRDLESTDPELMKRLEADGLRKLLDQSSEVPKLSPQDVERFKKMLERARTESVDGQ